MAFTFNLKDALSKSETVTEIPNPQRGKTNQYETDLITFSKDKSVPLNNPVKLPLIPRASVCSVTNSLNAAIRSSPTIQNIMKKENFFIVANQRTVTNSDGLKELRIFLTKLKNTLGKTI